MRRGPPLPDGPTDDAVAPVWVTDVDRPVVLTLMAPGWRPPDDTITQSYGLCFVESGAVVLVAWAPGRWNLPGGTIEPGESPEQALDREVAEEACATVIARRYLASQHVWDPEHPDGPASHYQSRWWARVRLDPWVPEHEMIARAVVPAADVTTTLYWHETTIADRLLDLALDAETSYRLRDD